MRNAKGVLIATLICSSFQIASVGYMDRAYSAPTGAAEDAYELPTRDELEIWRHDADRLVKASPDDNTSREDVAVVVNWNREVIAASQIVRDRSISANDQLMQAFPTWSPSMSRLTGMSCLNATAESPRTYCVMWTIIGRDKLPGH